ncbi:MAG: hypothetical protein JO092_11075, partial [Candidatus Eremiobacteraeota bacterium]|nr:hypothetical protein [Candidatus Eremiobacteraeota bacterium]
MAEIVFLVGSKGGVGTTTTAAHVAKYLARSRSTLLVDGDLAGHRNAAVLFDAVAKLDARRAEEDLPVAGVGENLALLELAGNVHDGFTIKPERVDKLLSTLPHIQAIVVDAPQPFAAAVRPLAVRASNFVIVAEPSVLGVTSARIMQLELSKFGVPASHLKLLFCLRDARAKTPPSDIERALGIPSLGEIPPEDDRRFQKAIDQVAAKVQGALTSPTEMLVLQPSASTPIGERRMGKRRIGAEEPAGGTSNQEQRAETLQMQKSARDELKSEIHRELSRRIDFAAAANASGADQLKIEELRAEVNETVAEFVANRDD